MSDIPDYPPESWGERSSYSNIPIPTDGPVVNWVNALLGPHGYGWNQVTEWRWVGGEIPFAQFVCIRPDGGRDWLTINYTEPPPIPIDEDPTRKLI